MLAPEPVLKSYFDKTQLNKANFINLKFNFVKIEYKQDKDPGSNLNQYFFYLKKI